MSQSMYICYMDCKEGLWVGQRDTFYSGEPHTMEALRRFLIKHRSYYAPRTGGSEYHELVYIPEPYNEYIKDYHTDNWVQWNADKCGQIVDKHFFPTSGKNAGKGRPASEQSNDSKCECDNCVDKSNGWEPSTPTSTDTKIDDLLESLYEKLNGSDSVDDRLSLITAKTALKTLLTSEKNRARVSEIQICTEFLKKAGLYDQDSAMKLSYHFKVRLTQLREME